MVIRICARSEDLSLELLQDVLEAPSLRSFKVTPVSSGRQGSTCRIHLCYASIDTVSEPTPASVLLKLASTDAASHRSNMALGLYEREVRFYSEVVPTVLTKLTSSIPQCFAADYRPEDGACTILLSDVGESAVLGDDIAGATIEEARIAIAELAHVHAIFLRQSEDMDASRAKSKAWLDRASPLDGALFAQLFAGFKARYQSRLSPEVMTLCERFADAFEDYKRLAEEHCVFGMIHGTFRMANMLFSTRAVREGRSQSMAELAITINDWQTVSWGPLAGDIAYFLGCALRVEDRREWLEELLQTYCDAVGEQQGDPLFPLETCRENLRWQAFFGITKDIVSSMLAEQTETEEEMLMVTMQRHCQLVIDLRADDLLPDAASR